MLVLEETFQARHDLYTVRAKVLHRVQARGYDMKFGIVSSDIEIEAKDPTVYRALAEKLKLQTKKGNLRLAMKSGRTGVSGITDSLRDIRIVATPKSSGTSLVVSQPQQAPLLPPKAQVKQQLYCQAESADVKVPSPTCHSPGSILPDVPAPSLSEPEPDKTSGLTAEATHADTQAWLTRQRFAQHRHTFANFSGADLLRLSRDDLVQICGLADGIRLFNALHAKRIEPRLTLYVCAGGGGVYSAVYLHSCLAAELLNKLKQLLGSAAKTEGTDSVLVSGPGGARVRLTDELVRHLPDNSTYRLQRASSTDNTLLLTPTQH